MPYKDPAKQAEAQRRYRKQRLTEVRAADRARKRKARLVNPQRQYTRASRRSLSDLDNKPNACYYRFFASKPCRLKARFVSPTGARWCSLHSEGWASLSCIE